ncbi:MAG: efflux RND transporter periplasmic adaptor subunit [Bacteroidia bacterium]|nr:efflux RND transporter periplasmic adaptor subunit [Bacteroidia bacterium]
MMTKQFLLFPLTILLLVSCGRKGEVITPVRRDLVQAVYASGKIFPENGYKVYSKLPGYVEKIHVKVGDSIRVGQALITIKSEVSELNVTAAKNLLELAGRNASDDSPLLKALKQDLASARAKYELDSVNYQRYQNLYKENAGSKLQLDASKTQFEISVQNYLKASNNFYATRDRLLTEYKNAQVQYDAQVSNRSDYTLVSGVNGTVYDVIPKEGELVGTQLALLEIGNTTGFYVELSVDETDIALLEQDQEVLYMIDAYKDKTFTGKIREIYPRISQNNKTSKVLAGIDPGTEVKIFSGMSVEANIIVARKTSILVIPRECLLGTGKVILASGDTVTVKKGAEDLQFVEILAGLEETSEVIKP